MNRLNASEQSAISNAGTTDSAAGNRARNGDRAVDVVTAHYAAEEHRFRQERFAQALRRASSTKGSS